MKRSILFGLVSLVGFTACGPTQSYVGPAREDAEVGKIYFYSQRPIKLSSWSVDGVTQSVFDMGIAVLPGQHPFFAEYTIVGENCSEFGVCRDETRAGVCKGTVRVEAGRTYEIRAQAVTDSAFVAVRDEATGSTSGSGTCEERSYQSRISEKEREKWRRDREQIRRDRWD